MSIEADHEGPINVYLKKKFKPKHAIVSAGSLLLKDKAKNEAYTQNYNLKGAKVSDGAAGNSDVKAKEKFVLSVTADGLTHIIQCPDEKSCKAWKSALEAAASKEQVKVGLAKKKQSLGMAIKKNVSGKAATSGAGKGLIKDELGKNGVRVIEIMKAIITLHDGKKKATEVEDNVIRLAVKIILLWKNKDITTPELMKTLPYLRSVWSNLIDFCEMSFAYDPAELAKNTKELADFFVELLQQHITDKTVTMIQETLTYATQEALMDRLFKDDEGEEYKKELETIVRGAWIKLFKDAKK